MVEVVTREEFDEFKKLIEDRLNKREENTKKSMDARVKLFAAINTRLDKIDEDRIAIHGKLDEVEEKSKSIVTKIKEAFEPAPE